MWQRVLLAVKSRHGVVAIVRVNHLEAFSTQVNGHSSVLVMTHVVEL